jgi:hypothetical protein
MADDRTARRTKWTTRRLKERVGMIPWIGDPVHSNHDDDEVSNDGHFDSAGGSVEEQRL